jgi:hypothetical protein
MVLLTLKWDTISEFFCTVLYPAIMNALPMSHEAFFHLTGYVNNTVLCANNPYELCPFPVHILKVTVSCAVSFCGIISPYFSQDDMECVVTVSSGMKFCKISWPMNCIIVTCLCGFSKLEPLLTVHG